MAIPGYKLPWHRNPAFGSLAADIALAACATAGGTMAFLARGGSIVGSEGAIALLAFTGASVKAWLTWKDKGKTHSHHGLVGCLHTLDSVLRASTEDNSDVGLRLTVHTPIAVADEIQLEQVVDYVSIKPELRKGVGRRFMQQCGILGQAFRERKPLVAEREQENYEAYLDELVNKWHYSRDQARQLRTDGKSFMAVPLTDNDGVQAVLYLDSSKPQFFTGNRVELVGNACVGIALFIGRQYIKN